MKSAGCRRLQACLLDLVCSWLSCMFCILSPVSRLSPWLNLFASSKIETPFSPNMGAKVWFLPCLLSFPCFLCVFRCFFFCGLAPSVVPSTGDIGIRWYKLPFHPLAFAQNAFCMRSFSLTFKPAIIKIDKSTSPAPVLRRCSAIILTNLAFVFSGACMPKLVATLSAIMSLATWSVWATMALARMVAGFIRASGMSS